MTKPDILEFTPELTAEFKRELKHALKCELETFEFKGRVFLVAYARYLLEYLESRRD